MADIFLSGFEALTSQGDLTATVKRISGLSTSHSSKHVLTDVQDVHVPYHLLPEPVQDDKSDIYRALDNLVGKLVDGVPAHQHSTTMLIIGTTLADLDLGHGLEEDLGVEERRSNDDSGTVLKKTSIDDYASRLAAAYGLCDMTMTINTACTSTANAILEGSNLLQAGLVDNVIVAGIEVYSQYMTNGFEAMGLMSYGEQKPFTDAADGLVLGEGVAGLVLSSRKSRHRLLGGYSNCNAETVTGVSESGQEYVAVMQSALADAGVAMQELTAIKAHAIATLGGDRSEMNALKMFPTLPMMSAIKPYVGHTVGACGVLELGIFLSCIERGFIPKFPSDEKHMACSKGVFLLNYFGFGGNNVSLLVESEEHEAVH